MSLAVVPPRLSVSSSFAVFYAKAFAILGGPLAFAFVGGYGDTAGYLLANTFTGHITGAFVLSAISVAGGDWHTYFLCLAGIACFLSGVFLAAVLDHYLKNKFSKCILTIVMAAETVLFTFGFLAMTSSLKSNHELLVACLSLALGLQNGVWRRSGGISVHTTFFTGMILNLVEKETEIDLFHTPTAPVTSLKSRIGFSCGVWLAFLFGATIGAAAVIHLHAVGILGVVLVLILMLVSSLLAVLFKPRTDSHPVGPTSATGAIA
ncbi:MAG TPA: YoaK family protein [Candidatus Acidoferrales bacterium]|nr:YoaK family protein [Candidatus Acidoferrales bacterium]